MDKEGLAGGGVCVFFSGWAGSVSFGYWWSASKKAVGCLWFFALKDMCAGTYLEGETCYGFIYNNTNIDIDTFWCSVFVGDGCV